MIGIINPRKHTIASRSPELMHSYTPKWKEMAYRIYHVINRIFQKKPTISPCSPALTHSATPRGKETLGSKEWIETVHKLPVEKKLDILSHLLKMNVSQTDLKEFHNLSLSERTKESITVLQTLEQKSTQQAFLEISLLDTLWALSPSSPHTMSSSLSTGAHDPENWHKQSSYGDAKNWQLQQKKYDDWYASMICRTHYILNYFASGQNGMTLQDLPIMGLIHLIALERRMIANELNHQQTNDVKFGFWRKLSLETEIHAQSRYSRYFDKLKAIYNKGGDSISIINGHPTFLVPQPSRSSPRPQVKRLSFVWNIPLCKTPHFCIVHTEEPLLIHKNRHAICKFLHQTVCSALTPNITRENLYSSLATLHWWLAQLTIFDRGSASITEIFIQAIAVQQGYPSPKWVPGILPDLEAIPRDEEDFVKIYPDLLLLESSAKHV